MTTSSTILPTHSDILRIARSLRRAGLFKQYSHGTVKRSAMAMINYYMRLAGHNFARSPHDLHAVM